MKKALECLVGLSLILAISVFAWANKYTHINTATTTVISNANFVQTITINTLVGSEAVFLYDVTSANCNNAASTQAGKITLPTTTNAATPFTVNFGDGIKFTNGICIGTTSTADLTVSTK